MIGAEFHVLLPIGVRDGSKKNKTNMDLLMSPDFFQKQLDMRVEQSIKSLEFYRKLLAHKGPVVFVNGKR